MSDLETFRSETRKWLEENCPPSMRRPLSDEDEEAVWGGRKARYTNPELPLWRERMVARGWTAPTWPREYGGGGLSADEAKVLAQEMRSLGCRPPLVSFGLSMLGPVLLEYGTDEQKREHLPPLIRGEIRWCQGYSEPGAGSDLAGLQCKAVRGSDAEGDPYRVTGQKIWTSFADRSDWIFCLVRTDFEAPKHDGISFLLIDMESPGISTAPIQLISGSSPFCQTFFEDVRVPARNRVGKENGGWTIAKRLLQHERSMISGMGQGGLIGGGGARAFTELARSSLGCPEGPLSDAVLRDAITRVQLDNVCFNATLRRSADAARAGRGPGAESSMFKYYGTELNKRRCDLRTRIAGTRALGWEGEGFEPHELQLTRDWLRSKGNSIEGGTSEIQLNIIAKRVLGLPD
ncbi:MAG: acyl-CoA dehydrogenase family protein [Myxococcota bacterium]